MRALGLLPLLAGVLAAQELPHKAQLRQAHLKYTLRRNYPLPEGVQAAEKPVVRSGRLGRDVTYFVDVDGNGKFNDWNVDGWSLSKMAYMLPLEKKTIIGVNDIVWDVAEDGKDVYYKLTPLGIKPAQRQILIQFNTWRMMNGLPAVTVDQALSIACGKHCEYMEKNGFEHTELPDKEGFTEEGAAAGMRSCLSRFEPNLSVLMFYATFYHRLPLIRPGTRAIGIGKSKRYTAIDALSRREERPWLYPIIVPAPNTFFHPTHFPREAPDPVPPETKAGFPITLTFQTDAISGVQAAMWREATKKEKRLQGKKRVELDILVSWPGKPAHKMHQDNRKSICIIPRAPLWPKWDYHVRVAYKLYEEPHEKTWVFRTGPQGPGPAVRGK